jgi:DNA-nicking Smr family endonuclease
VKKPRAIRPDYSRHLSSEEIDLWLQATRAVRPWANRQPLEAPRNSASPPPQPGTEPVPSGMVDKPPVPGVPPLAPLERRLRQRLQRGQADVQGVVDLHGLREAEAHRALQSFLRQAQANGARIVLVITGKGLSGRPADDKAAQGGVLRRSVPQWLRASELRSVVIGFEQAGIAHGGAGALYVRIRRPAGSGSSMR